MQQDQLQLIGLRRLTGANSLADLPAMSRNYLGCVCLGRGDGVPFWCTGSAFWYSFTRHHQSDIGGPDSFYILEQCLWAFSFDYLGCGI